MPFISSCPKCQKQVTVPDRVGAASLMRCPLCEVEFELSEALALAPPALIIITAKTDNGQLIPPAAKAAKFAPDAELIEFAPAGEPGALAEAQPALAKDGDEDHWTSGWAAAGDAATAEQAEHAEHAELAEGETDAAVFGAITGKHLPGAEGEGLLPRPPAGEGAELPPLPKRRRRRREPNPVRVFVGCALMGVLAVVVAYWGRTNSAASDMTSSISGCPSCRTPTSIGVGGRLGIGRRPPVPKKDTTVAVTPPKNSKPAKPKPPASDYPDIDVTPIKPPPTQPLKATTPKTEAPKADAKKTDIKKTEPPKTEPPKTETTPPKGTAPVPPAGEQPDATPPDEGSEGLPPEASPSESSKIKPATAPDMVPTPIGPEHPDKSKPESPVKPDKSETPPPPAKPDKSETPPPPAKPDKSERRRLPPSRTHPRQRPLCRRPQRR